MNLRAKNGCFHLNLRICCLVIATSILLVLMVGIVIKPKILKSMKYGLNAFITIAANLSLIVGAFMRKKFLLLIWFAYAVIFLLGYPYGLESLLVYYRFLYHNFRTLYHLPTFFMEHLIIDALYFYFIWIVLSFYIELREEKS